MNKDDDNPLPPEDEGMVDRDDLGMGSSVDRDYDDDFPSASPGEFSGGAEASPDPGYAAFADELDDPLADWPSPERPLEDLPELRAQAEPNRDEGLSKNTSGTADTSQSIFADRGSDLFEAESENALTDPWGDELDEDVHYFDDPVDAGTGDDEAVDGDPGSDPLAYSDGMNDLEDASHGSALVPDVSDIDAGDPPVQSVDRDGEDDLADPFAAADEDRDAAAVKESTAFADERDSAGLATTGGEPGTRGSSRGAIPDLIPPPPAVDDGYVDDFLNDLDPPELDSPEFATGPSQSADFGEVGDAPDVPAFDPPAFDDAMRESLDDPGRVMGDSGVDESDSYGHVRDNVSAEESVASSADPAADIATIERASSIESAGMQESLYGAPDQEETPVNDPEDTALMEDAPEPTGRKLPVVTIIVLCVALVLLGVGGYGVLQQRSEMQAEIRDLRAQLATTITPEEAAAERERQRQVELENESLNAELEGLTAENSELTERLGSLEASLAAQEAEATRAAARAAEESARQAAAARRAASSANASASAPATSPGAVSEAGTWFVNFGSYAQRNVADRWAAQLEVESGRVGVLTATAAGKTLYRVRVLGLPDRDTAERIATGLERQYQLPRLWVGRSE